MEALGTLQLYAGKLKLVRTVQLLLFLIWMVGLAAYIVLVITERSDGLLVAAAATTIAPVLVACLMFVQIFWASVAKRSYEETGRLLALRDIRPDLRMQAKEVISEFQIQAKPLFVRGRTSEALFLALFVAGMILSFAFVLFLR